MLHHLGNVEDYSQKNGTSMFPHAVNGANELRSVSTFLWSWIAKLSEFANDLVS